MVFLFQTTRTKHASIADSEATLTAGESKTRGAFVVPTSKRANAMLKSVPVRTDSLVVIAKKRMTMQEALDAASKGGYNILSNHESNVWLQGGKLSPEEKRAFPCWTGTLVAYKKPQEELGETIQFAGLTLAVPAEWQHKKNVMIVCEQGDFEIKDGAITIGKADLVPIPAENGWYIPDVHGIPNGEKSKSKNPNARYLWKSDEHYVGLLVRGNGYGIAGYLRGVYASIPPSERFGVLGEKTGEQKNLTARKQFQ